MYAYPALASPLASLLPVIMCPLFSNCRSLNLVLILNVKGRPPQSGFQPQRGATDSNSSHDVCFAHILTRTSNAASKTLRHLSIQTNAPSFTPSQSDHYCLWTHAIPVYVISTQNCPADSHTVVKTPNLPPSQIRCIQEMSLSRYVNRPSLASY